MKCGGNCGEFDQYDVRRLRQRLMGDYSKINETTLAKTTQGAMLLLRSNGQHEEASLVEAFKTFHFS